MLKLQRVVAYKRGEKVQHKFIITIPEDTVNNLGWKEGSELKDSIQGKSLVIDFVSLPIKKKPKIAEPKMSYEEFRDRIKKALEYSDTGMTWTELRGHLKLDQVVPNNKWVRKMETDIGLMRLKEVRGVVWKVRHV